jgi:O-antigen ligase
MRFRWADTAGAAPASLLLPGLVLALLAGMVTAAVGSMAGYRAIYYVALFGFIVLGGLVALTRAEPLRFVFLALIVCFPIANAIVPPGRIGLSVFDVTMVALAIALVGKRLLGPVAGRALLFPTRSLLVAWLLVIPCVVLSQFPALSLMMFILGFGVYAFFLFALDELRRERGFERLVLLFSIVLLFMASGLLIEHFLRVPLHMQGANFNQLSYSGAGFEIHRAGGFFQDPQKAGAFLSCLTTFLLLLALRGRFRDMKTRYVVWVAIVLSAVALMTTISRTAILAFLLASGTALIALNRWNALAKLVILASVIPIAALAALTPVETWLSMAPAAVEERFLQMSRDLEFRTMVWFDTWNMFADHPLAGIGLGSFQSFLMKTQPTVFNYYGFGEATGVAYIPDQPESGYFKILYEGGIAGSAAVLLVVADALRRAGVLIASPRVNSDARTETIAALAALVNFGLTFVALFTANDPRIAALFAFLLAVIWHRSLPRAQAAAKS